MAMNSTMHTLLNRVKDIAPILRRHTAEAESQRRLARPMVEAMLQAGLYSMSSPQAFGGLEVDPVTMCQVVEEVARHSAAAGWNLDLSLGGNFLPAWLPDEGAAEIMYSHPQPIIVGSFTPGQQATAVEGGYRLSGEWSFVSGSHEGHWFLFRPAIMDGEQPRRNDQGKPVQRFMFLPADKVHIRDTWHTLGMQGTGTNDVVVPETFVPERHTALAIPLEKPGKAYQGPLYRLSIWLPIALNAPPALGIARAALDDLIALAQTKTPGYTGASLGRRQVVQRQVAEAEATLSAGRAYLHAVLQESWQAALQGVEVTRPQKLNVQLATSHAVACAAKAVDIVHAAAGISSVRNEYPFQRYFRDIHTLTQHAFVSASRYESVGAHLLGVEADWDFFDL